MRRKSNLMNSLSAFSCSFEIIQVPFKQNKSPIQFVDHHLGIESWCIKFVYQYAHRLIISQRKQSRIPPSIVKYLNCANLINPDVSTFWNLRRMLVERVQLSITQEFQFSALVLTKKPKSSEAFFYRRWLYSFQSKYEVNTCDCCKISYTYYNPKIHKNVTKNLFLSLAIHSVDAESKTFFHYKQNYQKK